MNYFKLKFLLLFFALAVAIPPAWAETVTLTQSVLGLTGQYTTSTEKTVDGITYVYTDLMKSTDYIQAKASTGEIYNKTSFPGNITSVTINWGKNTEKSSTISGSSDGTNWTQVATGSGTITGDFSGKGYKYFKITRGSNAAYWSSIVITYETGGSTTEKVATPTFSPASGSYTEAPSVEISCATDGATIYYTTDGTDPTTSSTKYISAIAISETTTLKAIAMKDGMEPSSIAEAVYTIIDPSTLTQYRKITNMSEFKDGDYLIVCENNNVAFNGSLAPIDAAGNYFGVEIKNSVISTNVEGYFTVQKVSGGNYKFRSASGYAIGRDENKNGMNTSNSATVYLNKVSFDNNGNAVITGLTSDNQETIDLQFFNSGNDSRFRYYLSTQQPIQLYKKVTGDEPVVETVATPTFSVEEGSYTEALSVEITCATEDATIYYTTDGSEPTASSTEYTGAISINETTTLKAIAVKDGMNDSQVATATYTINVPAEERTYNKVTDASQLIAGKKYILVYEDTPAFMGAISTTSTTYGLSITGPELEGSSVNIGQYGNIRELTLSGDASGWNFHNGEGYLTCTSTKSLNVATEISDKATWTVSKNDDGFVLTNKAVTSRILQYNASSPRFACYEGTQQSAVLYVEDGVKPSVLPTVATPTFEPAPQEEAFTTVQNVTITCATVDAAIHYTTDGTEPTAESAVYSQPIVVNDGTTTIKAIAIKEGMTNSEVASATYTVNLPTLDAPTFDHESNIYDGAFEVTITAAEDATIYYTTDGTAPTTESAVYKDRIPVNKNMTIKAIAVKEGYKTSAVATAEYQIKVAKPTFSPVPGTFDAATQVSIACGTEGATIHYTTDGTTEPTAESPVYSEAIAVKEGTMTIKAIAIKEDMTNSDIAEGVYTIKQNAGLNFDPKQYNLYVGVEFNAPTLEAPEGLTVTYESSNTNVAEVNAETGAVTIKAAGEATITASWEATDTYTAGSTSYTITVENKPFVMAEPTSLDFEAVIGQDPVTETFTVMAENLKGDITLTLSESDVFKITPATIAKADMTEDGVEVTVTYTPKAATGEDSDEATVTIKSTDADDVKVNLTGMATLPDPELTVSPETLEMGTEPTGTFTVTGQNLTENVTLTVTVTEGEAKNFEISPATIIPDEEGKVSQEVTVTYKGNSTEDEYATITVKSGIAKKEVIVTARVLPTPEIIAEPESLTMSAKVGETATATFNVLGTDLKEVVTLTLNDANGVYTINPESISIKDAEEGATVTVTYAPTAAGSHEAIISVTTKDAETATVTLNGTATVPEVVAMPTFSLVAGSYTGPQTVTIYCATEGATISYSTDGGQTWKEGNTVNVDKDMTIMAKAEKDGMTVSTTASATYVIITEEAPVTVNIETGYYQIKNLGNGLYANVAGRKTLNFTNAPADKAGTVIYVDVENDGTVKSLRSQAADLQRYADRAMSYVPEVVKIVAKKLNADGSGEILGETGLGKILDKFNECFDHNLHVEQAEGGYRLYGKTPSMQPVVEFYRENKDKVEAKLPNLEAFINSALEKLKAKIGGSSVFTEFKLHDIWDKMGGTLTEPVDAASTMAFYREVLNNKNYVWDFAYQTAMIYVNNLMNHPRWSEVEEQLGEYAQYIDKIDQIRPEFKYYIVQKDGKPDFISEGNKDIIDNAERTIWSLEPRTGFTVNFPEANKHNGEYVTTLYTDFAYTLPKGVTAYTVTEVSTQGVATLTALEGTIPAQTPVLLKSTAAGPQTVTLSTEAGTAPADNLLVGPDYLIKHYEFKTPQVVDIFNFIKDKLPGFYEEYVAQYEYLMLKTAGTVGNKYFWNVNSDLAGLKDDCIVRSLAVDENGTLAFSDHWTTETNKAFLVDDANNPQDVIKLPSLRGDINKDGVISIIDVTALIDILLDLPARTYLNPTDTYPKGLDYEAADVNENKDIEITDVTTLIDILLNMPDQPAQGSGN